MATVFGHAMAAVAAARAPGRGGTARLFSWPVAAAAIFLAAAPDLDIVVWILLKPAGMTPHRGPSHSLLMGLLLAAGCWLALSRGGRRGGVRLPAALALAAFTHPLLDYLMGCGPPVPLFWPWIKTGYLSPVQLIPTAYYSKSVPGLIALLFSPRRMIGVVFEAGIFAPLLLAQWKAGPGRRARWWIPAGIVSAGSVVAVYLLYDRNALGF